MRAAQHLNRGQHGAKSENRSKRPFRRAYADAILDLPALREWMDAAMAETETLAQFEPYG